MAEVLQFVPNASRSARANLQAFIDGCRSGSLTFGPAVAFESDVWDVTGARSQRASDARQRITFRTLSSTRARIPELMRQSYRNFAKAYLLHTQGLRPSKNQHTRLSALRALHDGLAEQTGTADLDRVESSTFDRAAQLLRRHLSANTAYKSGASLEELARFIEDSRFAAGPLTWRNPIPRPEQGTRIGKEFEARRRTKMPDASALGALAEAFNAAKAPADVIVTSAASILCSCPARISELLSLPAECEATTSAFGSELYGLRWWPAKGAAPQVKWVVPSMAQVVRRALERLRHHTNQARSVAAWYERYPSRVYLPKDLRYLREVEFLSYAQISQILGGCDGKYFVYGQRIPHLNRAGRTLVRFRDVERAICALLPRGFPVFDAHSGVRYSEALFVVPLRQFGREDMTPVTCMVQRVSPREINDGLGAGVRHGRHSVFSRLGLVKEGGAPIALTTHMFRHYLNTLAQGRGLSQLDIATWSGRKDVRQNVSYDHESASSLLARVRGTMGDPKRWLGPLGELARRAPASITEFARQAVPTAHTTDIGYCLHDYSMTPCQLHLDCLHCTEHVCIKGDTEKTDRVRARLGEARLLLDRARAALSEQDFGADRWCAHHGATVERLEALLKILDDPAVPPGSVVQLGSAQAPSALRRAQEAREVSEGAVSPRHQLTTREKGHGTPRQKPHRR